MTAACPLPAAKFVDLRSSLSFDRGSSTSSAEAKGWAALAGHLAKAVPICPRKGSVLSDDVCIAAHHVVRGADSSGTNTMVSRSVGKPGVRGKNRLFTGGSGKDMAGSAAAMDEAASKASDALRKHHGCPEWRTATDVSCSPGEKIVSIDSDRRYGGTILRRQRRENGVSYTVRGKACLEDIYRPLDDVILPTIFHSKAHRTVHLLPCPI